MTFPTYPATAYVDGNPVTGKLAHGVLNTWRRWQTFAIDIANGGVYVPSTVISIGGSGITLTGSSQRLGLSSRRITRYQALAGNSSSANWSVNTTTATADWINTATGGRLWLELDNLPDGGTLDEVALRWDGASGHANDPVTDGGTLVMPAIEVFAIDEDGAQTSLGSQTDTTTGRTAYEAAHDIAVTGLSHTIDLTAYRYAVEVTGETGADFQANAAALSLRTETIVDEYPEW